MNSSHQLSLSFADILSTLDIFDTSLKDLNYEADQPKSAVAIIVKRKNISKMQTTIDDAIFVHDQILFLQRTQSSKDRFSGEICFPGGRQQPNESLLETVIRQTLQQTNIMLHQRSLVGCIDRKINLLRSTRKSTTNNSQTKRIKQKQMVVYVFVFCVQEEQMASQTIKLNEKQIQDYKWVAVNQLTKASNVCWLDYTKRMKSLTTLYNHNQMVRENTISSLQIVSRAISPAINIGMNEKLYGVTLYITEIILVSFMLKLSQLLEQSSQVLLEESVHLCKNKICELKEIQQRCSANIVLEVNQPITDTFRNFEKALIDGIHLLRPKL